MDGTPRIASFRRVKGYPLVVVVGLSRTEVLANAERHRVIYFLSASFVSILILLFKAMVVRRQIGLQRARDKLWEAANFDSLTGLPNRNRLHEVVNTLIANPESRREPFALLLLRPRQLQVRQRHARSRGRRPRAAHRRRAHPPDCHAARNLVARLGGDEFAVLMRGTTEREAVKPDGPRHHAFAATQDELPRSVDRNFR